MRLTHFLHTLNRGMMALWLASRTSHCVIQVLFFNCVILLCSSARHFTLAVPDSPPARVNRYGPIIMFGGGGDG